MCSLVDKTHSESLVNFFIGLISLFILSLSYFYLSSRVGLIRLSVDLSFCAVQEALVYQHPCARARLYRQVGFLTVEV